MNELSDEHSLEIDVHKTQLNEVIEYGKTREAKRASSLVLQRMWRNKKYKQQLKHILKEIKKATIKRQEEIFHQKEKNRMDSNALVMKKETELHSKSIQELCTQHEIELNRLKEQHDFYNEEKVKQMENNNLVLIQKYTNELETTKKEGEYSKRKRACNRVYGAL